MTTERRIETEITINASIEAVWAALTDAKELANWFPLDARVTPGKGGSVWMGWGKGVEFETPIGAWEEGRRLQLIYAEPQEASEHFPKIPFRIAVDYHLEAAGGATVLRLVHSGFSSDASWDDQYDGTVRGWAFQFRGLRHYLETHAGTDRVVVHAVAPLADRSFEDAWAQLTRPGQFIKEGSLEGLAVGDRYALTTTDGDRLEGEVRILMPPREVCGTIESLNDAFFRMSLDPACFTQARAEVNLWISTYGVPTSDTGALQSRLQTSLDRALASEGG